MSTAVQNLVVVESPAKARTINRYLGPDYLVVSSVGHVRDLPRKSERKKQANKHLLPRAKLKNMPEEEKAAYRARLKHMNTIKNMAIDPENGWKANYQIIPEKKKVVKMLRKRSRTLPLDFPRNRP